MNDLFDNFQCSKTCGEGNKRRIVECLDMEGNSSEQCEERKKPQKYMICNTDPCPIWNFGGWGQVRDCFQFEASNSLAHYCIIFITI